MEHTDKLFLGLIVEILCKAQTVAALFKASDSLLESFLVGLADAHYFAHSTHLSTKLVLGVLELLKCPACKLDNDVVTVGIILVKSTVLAAGDILQSKTCCQHCGNKCDREACCLGSKCGGT
ncbi:unknown [Ruminococcus sp. CAG:353]|nr:unknown [Ruminococcus sp. CAG:353]